MNNRIFLISLYFFLFVGSTVSGWNEEYAILGDNVNFDKIRPIIVPLDHERIRRDVDSTLSPTTMPTPTTSSTKNIITSSDVPINTTIYVTIANTTENNSTSSNISTNNTNVEDNDKNRTTKQTSTISTTVPPTVDITKIPLLGTNGSGIFHGNTNITNSTVVSEPILPNDNLTNIFKETPEIIKAEQNITNLKYDNHTFYKSVFIGNISYFNEHWANITNSKPNVHELLSNSHRRAATMKLSFPFPFYGHPLREITVATGGFIYTGDPFHNWLAATQYVAPLMANFDTTFSKESNVLFFDDGEKFTALWENVTLQEDASKPFTFAATLYKNGDIVFAYKNVPISINQINDIEHPVKVGISDAYLRDKIIFYVRQKTIYEYHRVSFKSYEIKNGTLLKLIALPTCLQYNTCDSCINHETEFNCTWCEQLQKCSSGIDRDKQEWTVRNCDRLQIKSLEQCPTKPLNGTSPHDNSTVYVTDTKINPFHDAVIGHRTLPRQPKVGAPDNTAINAHAAGVSHVDESGSHIGSIVAAIIVVTLVCSLSAWVFYAFKNPHTRSGQLLIKYRPTQWRWRRGEARYTAATIHM